MSAIEVGTWNVKAGYIGDVAPTQVLRSLWTPLSTRESGMNFMSLLRRISPASRAEMAEEDLVLRPMWSMRALESFKEPHVETLLRLHRHVLQCSSEEDPLMLVLPELWHERLDVMQTLCGLVLEGDIAPALYCIRPSVAWTLSQGRSTALVTDIGYSHVTTAAVLDGQTLRLSVDSHPMGAAAVTAQFSEMLRPSLQGPIASTFSHLSDHARGHLLQEMASEVKDRVGFVLSHRLSLAQAPAATEFRAPDGTPIELRPEERSQPYEVLFGSEAGRFNVAEMIVRVKAGLDPEWQAVTVQHLIAGGTSATPGLLPRLVEELKDKDAAYGRYDQEGGIQRVKKHRDGAWVGASLAASSSSFFPLWISKTEWEDEGEGVLYRKFFY